nr:hypothetical protein [Tanacetum cinerariifolium]
MKLNELMDLCTNLQSRVLELKKTKTTQALEIDSLKRRVKKLEKKQRSRIYKLKRLYKVGLTARMDSFKDEQHLCEDASKQGRIKAIDADEDITLVNDQDDVEMFNVNDLQGEEVVADKEVNAPGKIIVDSITTTDSAAATITTKEITLAQALVEIKTTKPKAKRAEEKRNKPPTQAQQRRIMCTYLKNIEEKKLKDLKNKSFDSIHKMFDRAFKRVNTFVDQRTELVEGSLKRVGEKLESAKKQKVDDDKETSELNQLMEIIPDKEEVAIDVIPLAVKSSRIVDWMIYKKGKKIYYQIISAAESSKMYMFFRQMLKSFDKEDLEDLYKLVKAKFGSTRPVEDLDLLLLVPPPYIGNFMPRKPDLSFTGLDEFANKPVDENVKAKFSKEESKAVRKNNNALIIKKWVSDDEEENGNPQVNLQDKGVIDSRCSRHMTGNMSYLTDYEEINRGYVTFRNPKGGKSKGYVDGKKVIILEASIRRDLQFADEEGVDCLPNSTIFEQLALIGKPTRKVTEVPHPSDPIEHDADEVVYKELRDSLVRAITTVSSLEAEQDSGAKKPWGIALLKLGLRMYLNFSMIHCLQEANEIDSLKKRVKTLERRNKSRTHKLKRLYKVRLTARVEPSGDEQSLGEDASKQERRIGSIDADENITLVSVQDDAKMFDADKDLCGEEVFVEQEVVADKEKIDEVTLAQALVKLKTSKPKVKGVVIHEPSEFLTTTTTIPKHQSLDKGKAIMIEEHVKHKKKDQIRLDEKAVLKWQAELQAEFDKEQKLARERERELKKIKKPTLL